MPEFSVIEHDFIVCKFTVLKTFSNWKDAELLRLNLSFANHKDPSCHYFVWAGDVSQFNF